MTYPALNPNRRVVFNPCVPSGDKLTFDVGVVASELLGIAHGNPKGEGLKLIRHTTLGEAFAMLDAVCASFDLIVSAPPAGVAPSKGLPKPPSTTPAGRKLLMSADAPAPEIDLGYAVWLVTNALLSPFGEAMLVLTQESYELVKRDPNAKRIWAVVPGNDAKVKIYLAREHRPRPGFTSYPPGQNPDRYNIHGTVYGQWQGNHQDSLRKFALVREELSRRALALTDDWNVVLDHNKLRVRFSPYALETGAVPRSLATEVETLLRDKTLLDLAVMRDTRDKAKALLTDKRLKVPPAVIAAFADVCRQMATLTAPFTRPSPVQRVAWLDEQDSIKCTRSFATFKAGESYPIRTESIMGKKTETRHRPGFGPEEVLVTGQEVLVAIRDTEGDDHAFTQFPVTEEMDEWHNYTADYAHTLSDLITHFAMPEVLDIAEADPKTYNLYRKRLENLQTA